MNNKISIGKQIKKLREQRGLTQEELAEKANISRSALANYESGVREPKGLILVRLAEVLETTADYILKGEDKEDVWPHSDEDPLKDLPEEARQSVMEFIEYVKAKYRNNKKKGD